MSKKPTILYVCSNCGYSQTSYLGRCPECSQWNTLEEKKISPVQNQNTVSLQIATPVPLSKVQVVLDTRLSTGLKEFDSVLGGGAMQRSAILIGGEPGIGKSTLLLQTASFVAKNATVLYVSGEESQGQIKNRAQRLCLDVKNIILLCTTQLSDIMAALDANKPGCVIIDSIQTIYAQEAGLVPSTVSQLKYCAAQLIEYAKTQDTIVFLTAHITKEGLIAGPKSLEHMVDTVVNFERNNDDIRFLRASKNRFGSIDEIGVFSMGEKGLECIENPSSMFITRRSQDLPSGVARAAVAEGSRVFLVEIQALTVPSKAAISRVYSDKIDSSRVSRVAAVLEKRAKINFSSQDIYINVAGGIRLSESAIDAALAAALYSARVDLPLSKDSLMIGEVSLAGEIRPVAKLKQRVKTALTLGFKKIFTPETTLDSICVSDINALIKQMI